MDRVDALIDHNAAMQRQINRLASEMLLLALAAIALAAGCTILGWQAWRAR